MLYQWLDKLCQSPPRETMDSPRVYGILFPFQRDGRGDFNKGEIDALLRSSILGILGVRGAGPTTQGELPWRTTFGSQTHRLRHANNDLALEDITRYFVIDALTVFEPRVRITDVVVSRETVSGLGPRAALRVKVSYVLRSSSTSSTIEVTEVFI